MLVVIESFMGTLGRTPLEAARAQGLQVAFVTRDVSRYTPNAQAREAFAACVDEVIEADVHDSAAVVTAVDQAYGRGELCGVYTTLDHYLPVVAEVARVLGLPGLDPDAAGACRNKLRTRQVAEAAGVGVPTWAWVRSEREAVAAAGRVGLPCVVKPMTEGGSVDVKLCRTEGEVIAQYHRIASVPTDYFGAPRVPGALVEEYLVGFEVSVESFTLRGERTLIGVTDKRLGGHPYFVEAGELFPSLLPHSVQKELVGTAFAALDAVGHDFGCAHVEVRMTAAGPRLIEINARMPGGQITRLIRESTGLNLQREQVRMHTGEEPDLTLRPVGAAAARFVAAPQDGTVRAVHGADLLGRLAGVVEVDVHVAPGDEVRVPRNSVDLLGSVVACGQNGGEALLRADAAIGQIGIEVA
ncbi:ATP-grasp domain-containing protein [Streptomyces antioxidans]|uniref:ATP-grasp domain-containing protein n=1 Tax=Streptomyces antioxidans TaxID=1507734 RepID=UPI00117CD477|nr:ATP-grasp domain-containing protein [Streptomyces antioxidans]